MEDNNVIDLEQARAERPMAEVMARAKLRRKRNAADRLARERMKDNKRVLNNCGLPKNTK